MTLTDNQSYCDFLSEWVKDFPLRVMLINGHPAEGSAMLDIDGTATKTIRGGTVITIAGVYAVHPLTGISYSNLKEIVVTADAPLSSGTGTISIYPALVAVGPFKNVSALPADNALITIVRTAVVEWGLGASWPEPVLPVPQPRPVLPCSALQEHSRLTTLPSPQMIEAGAGRIQAEREIFRKEGWGEPSDEHLAANAYEAMVFCAIGRGACRQKRRGRADGHHLAR